jgi:UTP--glucose-1-phosphate uridylyltransferase
MSQSITTLVLPVAGRGLRLRPLTLDTPKPLVPVSGKPILYYFIEEAALSGMRDVVLIISPGARENFDVFLDKISPQFPSLSFHVYEQQEPWGHGQAILAAYEFLKGKPFVIRFSDDLVFEDEPITLALSKLFEVYNRPMFLLEPVPWERASLYGIVKISRSLSPVLHQISEFVEKPKDPPSNLSVPGGYVYTPEMLENLKKAEAVAPKVPDGLLIYDAFCTELAQGKEVLGWQFPGRRFDCGNFEGLAQAESFLKENPKYYSF